MSDHLSHIKSPADVRKLNSLEAKELAQEIRKFLVDNVSKTGGHLGPNLGVVELSIALHRVFHSPEDVIIFDTGHQSYVHKILTGRQDFSKLRHKGGLSGYPSRSESKHDVVENSHASTALSWATGISLVKDQDKAKGYVVALIGDGALTGGMAWEALNSIVELAGRRLVILVNDNGRSYAPTIGGLAHHLDALRTSPGYEQILQWGKRNLKDRGGPAEFAYDALHSLKKGVKDMLAPQVMFEDLGIKYVGPVDGHDITAVEFALTRAKTYDGPVIVHAITEKGRGYTPAEQNKADRFHAVGVIHPETGLPVAPERFGWTAVFADEIVKIADQNPHVYGITAAMLEPVGLAPLKKKYPSRVIDVGIAEQHALTTAAGMAYAGAHPVFAVYATFLNRGFDQLLMDCALHRAPVTIALDRAGITGADGASHNGMWDIAMATIIPGLKLAAPRDEATLREALREGVAQAESPNIIRYPKGSIPKPIPAVSKVGDIDVLVESNAHKLQILIVAVGAFAQLGIDSAQELSQQGFSVSCVNPVWVLPVSQTLKDLCSRADLVVTLEDGLADCGFGSALRAGLSNDDIFTPVKAFGIGKHFLSHASREQILEAEGLIPAVIAQDVAKAFNACAK